MGSAYGFGGIGKIIGPIGLALIVVIVPSFLYPAAWSALAGFAYAFMGFKTKERSIEDIDKGLTAGRQQPPGRVPVLRSIGDRRA